MNALDLKTEALCWLRFGRKLEYVATEVGRWSADVLGLGPTYSVEVEVKVSKSDLRREFESKKSKHYLYNHAEGGGSVPNYFYVYVPPALADVAVKLVEEHSPKAGVAVYEDDTVPAMDGRRTRVVRKAKKLHDKPPSPQTKRSVLLRMGSELCGRYIYQRDIVRDVMGHFNNFNDSLIATIKQAVETEDAETPDEPQDQ